MDLAVLQKILGVSFNEPNLLKQALVHSSYLNENPGSDLGSNERLEFLGDAVLGLVIAEKLYQDFPELTEGGMTKFRSVLVSRETLARVAAAAGLGEYLCLGKGEEVGGGRQNVANLAGVLEAVIAAIFLDQGSTVARDFVLNLLNEEILKANQQGVRVDYKSRLQELIQSRQQSVPNYRLVEATGPDHDRRFTVEVEVDDKVLGSGSGKSKKMAEIEAARSALESFSDITSLRSFS